MSIFNMAPKRNVKFTQPEVPSFLKKFKERVGYKEPANIHDKINDNVENSEGEIPAENDERQVELEEEPVVVVLKEGDLTAEEVQEYKKENSSTGIVFRNNKYKVIAYCLSMLHIGERREI